MTIDTNENRFHALKFAAQTLSNVSPQYILTAANLYLDFLEGRAQRVSEPTVPEPDYDDSKNACDTGECPICIDKQAREAAADTELDDLTESYPADEPVAVADSPQEDAWAAAERAISDEALVAELFEEGPHEAPFTTFRAVESISDLGPVFVEGAQFVDNVQVVEAADELYDAEAERRKAAQEFSEWQDEAGPEPTFEYVAAAVEQIAGSPPPTPDDSEAPEMNNDQAERAEELIAERPRQLEPVAAYVNMPTRTKWPWIG